MNREPKTLNLKYGEYYSLKVTDSSKNVINNVEITPVKLEFNQKVLTEYNQDFYESNQQVLERGMTDEQKDAVKEWCYKSADSLDYPMREKPFSHEGTVVSRHELVCEAQVEVNYEKFLIAHGMAHLVKEYTVAFWADDVLMPEIVSETDTHAICSAKFNHQKMMIRLLFSSPLLWLHYIREPKNPLWEYKVLNVRFKLLGGALEVKKETKQEIVDEKSYILRGKHSFAFPENTLLQHDAETNFGGIRTSLTKHIADHILSRYKDGRETFQMTWQGDPRYTIGDRVRLENELGIIKEYMITGNEFILENSGKFYMRTEGISVLTASG